jgi:hypothetical protein
LAASLAFVLLRTVRFVLKTDKGGVTSMRYPTGPLFRPFDYALMVVFAMAFILLTTLRLA